MLVRHSLKIGRFLSIICTVVMMVFLSACAQGAGNNNTNSNQQPIKIGYSVSLAGDFSDDGHALQKGYELWRDNVNKNGGLLGRQIQLVSYNDNSDPQQVATNYQKLITSDKVDLLLGPFSTLLTAQAAPVAQKYGFALVEGAGTGKKVFTSNFSTIFGASAPSEFYLGTFAQFILALPAAQRPKSIAYSTVDNPFAIPQVAYGKKLFDAGQMKTVFDNTNKPYPEEQNDVSPIAKQIIAQKADVVIMGTVGVADCVSFLKTFKQQHYNPQAAICTSGPDEGKSFTDALGADSAEGIFVPNAGWYPAIKNYQNDTFVSTYIAKYGGSEQDINNGTVQGYSAAQVLEQVVTSAKTLDQKKLIAALRSGSFDTLQGPVKFGPDGANTAGVPFLFQWQKGQLIPVYPSSSALASPEFPKPNWPA